MLFEEPLDRVEFERAGKQEALSVVALLLLESLKLSQLLDPFAERLEPPDKLCPRVSTRFGFRAPRLASLDTTMVSRSAATIVSYIPGPPRRLSCKKRTRRAAANRDESRPGSLRNPILVIAAMAKPPR